VKKNPPLPTMTVTMAPLATPGHKTRSEVIAIATAKIWDECLFIAQISRLGNSNNPLSQAILKK
jgi:hypothetical protein